MNQKIILVGTILAITAISIPMIISETAPKPQQPNCEFPDNPTVQQIELLIESGCNIDKPSDIWDKDNGLIKIDEHQNVLEEYQFSTLSGFKIINESTILVNFNNSNNNAYFLGGEQIEDNIELFVFEKTFKIDDLFMLGAKQHDDVVVQIFELKTIDIENKTATFTHYASHMPLTDNLIQEDYVGNMVFILDKIE